MTTGTRSQPLEEAFEVAQRTASYRDAVLSVLAGSAAVAISTGVAADVVRFENTAGFDWWLAYDGLDITQPSDQQPHDRGEPGVFVHIADTLMEFEYGYIIAPTHGGIGPVTGNWDFLYGIDAGTLIGPGFGDFASRGAVGLGDKYYVYTLFKRDVPTYLAAMFPLNDGVHYGWLGVTARTDTILDLFAWGYETDPGVAIEAGAVPAPGTLAALAFGAVGLRQSRKRD